MPIMLPPSAKRWHDRRCGLRRQIDLDAPELLAPESNHEEQTEINMQSATCISTRALTQNEGPRTVRLALPPPCPRARKEIIVPGNSRTRPRRIDHELIRALARARSWMGMLQQGEYADTAEIAQHHDLSEPHVRRLLRFAYLAPDIVEAIVEGRQPRTLTVKLLLRGIPLDWSDQHAAFGLR